MLRFGKKKVAKEDFLMQKTTIQIGDVSLDNIVVSRLIKKTSSKYFLGYLDEVIGQLVLIFPKMSGYVKTFAVKYGDKDENNKVISLIMSYDKLLW